MHEGEGMPTGLRWRIELVEKILHEKQWNDKEPMNVVRGYVPSVFKYHRISRSPDHIKWFFSFKGEHIMRGSSYEWVKREIEIIGSEFSALPKLDNRAVIAVLEKHGWDVKEEARVIGCTGDKRIAWKYDGIKNHVAVEVELSSRPAIFKQCFKFLIGQGLAQIDLGVIMIHRHKIGMGPNFDSVDHDITRVFDAFPMLALIVHGF